MDKKRTLLEMQEDIKTIVGGMGITFDSIVDAESKINSYLAAMKHVVQLPDIGSPLRVEKVTDSEEIS
ncbi:hypothetical protein, partial [Bacillus mycoides]|uniref:hypothetical protein n=1 Tax=Bacillus mycoides TaxID=1405 RepID=UPI003A80BF32